MNRGFAMRQQQRRIPAVVGYIAHTADEAAGQARTALDITRCAILAGTPVVAPQSVRS